MGYFFIGVLGFKVIIKGGGEGGGEGDKGQGERRQQFLTMKPYPRSH
jgi:hypothetical protein